MRSLIEPGGGEQFSMLEQRRASWVYVLSINCLFYIDTFSYFFMMTKEMQPFEVYNLNLVSCNIL